MKPILQAAFAAALATAVLANDDPPKAVPAAGEKPTETQPAKTLESGPAVAAPVDAPAPKHKALGLDDILREGKLPVVGGGDNPFSGKLTLLGDDGNKREITYAKGQVESWVEWHEKGAVRVEREFANGTEVKRTGWRGDKKWFEITFAVDAAPVEKPAGHDNPAVPVTPPSVPEKPVPPVQEKPEEHPKPANPNGHEDSPDKPKKTEPVNPAPGKPGEQPKPADPSNTLPPNIPELPKSEDPTPLPELPKPPTPEKPEGGDHKESPVENEPSSSPKANPTKEPAVPESSLGKASDPLAANKTGSQENPPKLDPEVETARKYKWPAFVPGNPDFPPTKTTPATGTEASAQPKSKATLPETQSAEPTNPVNIAKGASAPEIPSSTAQVSPPAKPLLPKMETRPPESAAKTKAPPTAPVVTPAIRPVPQSVGPVAALRADHLVYIRGSALPYTGETTLLDENGKKTYEGGFLRGRREGLGMEWYATGQKKSEGEFRAGSLYEGVLYWYYIGTARKKMQVQYGAGKVIEARTWNRDGSLRW